MQRTSVYLIRRPIPSNSATRRTQFFKRTEDSKPAVLPRHVSKSQPVSRAHSPSTPPTAGDRIQSSSPTNYSSRTIHPISQEQDMYVESLQEFLVSPTESEHPKRAKRSRSRSRSRPRTGHPRHRSESHRRTSSAEIQYDRSPDVGETNARSSPSTRFSIGFVFFS